MKTLNHFFLRQEYHYIHYKDTSSLCDSLCLQKLMSRARRAGAKMEPMLVGKRQYQPLSMDIPRHFTPLFTAKR